MIQPQPTKGSIVLAKYQSLTGLTEQGPAIVVTDPDPAGNFDAVLFPAKSPGAHAVPVEVSRYDWRWPDPPRVPEPELPSVNLGDPVLFKGKQWSIVSHLDFGKFKLRREGDNEEIEETVAWKADLRRP